VPLRGEIRLEGSRITKVSHLHGDKNMDKNLELDKWKLTSSKSNLAKIPDKVLSREIGRMINRFWQLLCSYWKQDCAMMGS
jgi:hypothetical protein